MNLRPGWWRWLALVLMILPFGCGEPAEELVVTLAIRDVTVVDVVAGRNLPGRTVLIAGGRIAAVVAGEPPALPAGARVVDGEGRFLLPGLWDMHVHALWNPEVARLFFSWFVAHGVTGVRDMGGSLNLLDQVRADEGSAFPQMPRLVAAGPFLDGPLPVFPGFSEAIGNEEEGRAVVARLAERVDFLKVYSLLPRAAYLAVMDEARARGLPVAGHLPADVTAREAAEAGQRSIEHLRDEIEPFCAGEPEAECAALLALFREHSVWQTPTLGVLRAKAYMTDPGFVDQAVLARMPEVVRVEWLDALARKQAQGPADIAEKKKRFGFELELVGRMHAAGVPLLAGTDAGDQFQAPGTSLHEELALLVEAGLTPLDALRAATLEPARYLDRLADFGSVEAGKVADLVLLDSDPLADIVNTRKIAGVVLDGRWLSRQELEGVLASGQVASADVASPPSR